MISHTDCDHPSTSSARAKCRRARAKGEPAEARGFSEPLYSLGPPPASKKAVYFGKAHHDPDRERNRGTTPRDKDKECMVCHVERIGWRGTDPLTGIMLYVGERCTYMVEKSEDFVAVR